VRGKDLTFLKEGGGTVLFKKRKKDLEGKALNKQQEDNQASF